MDLIQKIQDKRDSFLVSYITSDRKGLETKISTDIFPMLHRHLSGIRNHSKVDVFLYSPGGEIIAGYGFVNLFREFCDEFNVIIPFKALSTATLIALGANEIIMSRMAQLSPVDPSISHPLGPTVQLPGQGGQILPVNVEDINAFFDLATSEAGLKGEEAISKVFEILASKVNPIVLGAVQRSRQQIAFLASNLMKYHTDDEERINKTVNILTRERFSHNYIIGKREAHEELGLNIVDADEELIDMIVSLFNAYNEVVKIDSPYSPELVLGDSDETVATFDRGIIESLNLTHSFKTVKSIRRITVQPGEGVPPQMGYQERILQEGWVEDAEL